MDSLDRTLVGLLQQDASRTYAELGRLVNLSAPAVHERVRKLRRSGVVRRTTVEVDPAALGRSVLAFVLLETAGWVKEPLLDAVRDDRRVEEVHVVAGDANVLLKVRVARTDELEEVVRRLYAVEGVVRTRTLTVLGRGFERAPAPDL